MNFAYLLKAHKNPAQVRRAILRFAFEGAHFLLTLDKYADIRAFRRELAKLPSHIPLHWITPREDGHWSGPGLVKSSLRALEYALQMHHPPQQILQISGQCYPIKPIDQLVKFFDGLGERFVMELIPPPFPSWEDGGLNRLNKYHYYLPRWLPWDKGWRTFPADHPPRTTKERVLHSWLSRRFPLPRTEPWNVPSYFGHAFWSLSNVAAAYVLDFHRRHPDVFAFHRYTFVVDEIYVQTLVGNSTYWKQQALPLHIHYCDWSKPNPPQILTMRHRDRLMQSNCLTARKFDTTVDVEILDWVDSNLLGI